jgi:hypothetical protein
VFSGGFAGQSSEGIEWISVRSIGGEIALSENKAMFIVGAIGGFIVAVNTLGGPNLYRNVVEVFLGVEALAFILVAVGFLGLWKKSGNFVPLVAVVFLLLQAVVKDLLYYLWEIDPIAWPFGPISPIQTTVLSSVIVVAWLFAALSVWMEREGFGPFALVAVLVFVIWAIFNAAFGLLLPIDFGDLPLDLDTWLGIINYAVAGIFFLAAAISEE